MPKRPAHRKYTENLLHGVKRLAEKTSPRKKRQKIEDSKSNKENVSCWQRRGLGTLLTLTHIENAALFRNCSCDKRKIAF
jgi:hypothetical protein